MATTNGHPGKAAGALGVTARVAQLSGRVERLTREVEGLAELVRGQNELLLRLYRQGPGPEAVPAARSAPATEPAGPAGGDGYADLVIRIRALVRSVVPFGARVAVASKGDEELLLLEGRRGWHFPQVAGGTYAGHHPVDGGHAITGLEALRKRGADFFVLPSTAFWWLEHYPDFAVHLDARYRLVMKEPETCLIYDLRPEGEPS